MGPSSYMRSVVDRNVFMRRIPLFVACIGQRFLGTSRVDNKHLILDSTYQLKQCLWQHLVRTEADGPLKSWGR